MIATLSGQQWSYNATRLLDGTHAGSVVATDNSGNTTSENFNMVVDTVSPTVTVTDPGVSGGIAASDTSAPTISLTVDDGWNSSGIHAKPASVHVRLEVSHEQKRGWPRLKKLSGE